MDENVVRRVLLVRSVEESDPEGELLPLAERRRAGYEARTKGPSADEDPGGHLATRADVLLEVLGEREPDLARLAGGGATGAGVGLALVALAFLLGIALDQLGPREAINVLSIPLLGLFAWNVATCAVALVLRVRPSAPVASAGRRRAPGWVARLGAWISSGAQGAGARAAKLSPVAARAVTGFLASWLGVGAPLHRARAERFLHLAAMALVLGCVVGMYLRGLVFEYRATWSSTFLDAATVHGLLAALFAPVAWLVPGPFPSVEAIEAMHARPQNAAPWIHHYAATAVLLVLLPRLVLFLWSGRIAARLERSFPWDPTEDAYARKLLAPERGTGMRVDVTPYSYEPTKRTVEYLRGALLDAFGNRSRIEYLPTFDYGEELGERERPPGDEPDDAVRILMFNLAQPPEQEVHGEWLEAHRAEVQSRRPEVPVAVVLDEARYRERLGTDAAADQRLDERRRAWLRMVEESGFTVVGLDAHGQTPWTIGSPAALRELVRRGAEARA